MLYFLRKKAKHFGFFLFGIIIIAFVFWVPGGFDGGDPDQGTLAKVGEIEISLLDFWTVFDNAESRIRDQGEEQLEGDAREQLKLDVLAGLIHEAAILQAAEDEGISVSNKEVESAIKSERAFWKDGAFDPQLFDYVLRQNRMDRKYYINARKKELIKEKMLSLADSVASLSPEEHQAVETFAKSSESVDIGEIKRQFLISKQDNVRISFSEGLKSEFFTTYDLELIQGK
jgi:peptidyl-prolyl cis-trans isomerase D